MSLTMTGAYYPLVRATILKIEPDRGDYICMIEELGEIRVHPNITHSQMPRNKGDVIALNELKKRGRRWSCQSIEIWRTNHQVMMKAIYSSIPALIRNLISRKEYAVSKSAFTNFVQVWLYLTNLEHGTRKGLIHILTNKDASEENKFIGALFLLTPNPYSVFLAFDMTMPPELIEERGFLGQWFTTNNSQDLSTRQVQLFYTEYLKALLAFLGKESGSWAAKTVDPLSDVALVLVPKLKQELASELLPFISPYEYTFALPGHMVPNSTRLFKLLSSPDIPVRWKIHFDREAQILAVQNATDEKGQKVAQVYAAVVFHLIEIRGQNPDRKTYWPQRGLHQQLKFVLKQELLDDPAIKKIFCDAGFLTAAFNVFRSPSFQDFRHRIIKEVMNRCLWTEISSELEARWLTTALEDFPELHNADDIKLLLGDYGKRLRLQRARGTRRENEIQRLLNKLS